MEVLRDKTFTARSDVWSFGVVCWELLSLGATPYAHIGLLIVLASVSDQWWIAFGSCIQLFFA